MTQNIPSDDLFPIMGAPSQELTDARNSLEALLNTANLSMDGSLIDLVKHKLETTFPVFSPLRWF